MHQRLTWCLNKHAAWLTLRMINRLEENVLVGLLIAMTLLVFGEVVCRFVFGIGISWAQELTLHMQAWFILFGISYGVRTGAHISVDNLVKNLNHQARRFIGLLVIFFSLCYCAFFIYGSWLYLEKIYLIGISMDDIRFPMAITNSMSESLLDILKVDVEYPLVPLWLAHGPMLLGFLLLAARFIQLGKRLIVDDSEWYGFSSMQNQRHGKFVSDKK